MDLIRVRTLHTCDLLTLVIHEHKRQPLPDDTVEAADLLVGVDSLVFAGEVLHAGCSTVSDLQMGRRVLQTHCWTLLSCCCRGRDEKPPILQKLSVIICTDRCVLVCPTLLYVYSPKFRISSPER